MIDYQLVKYFQDSSKLADPSFLTKLTLLRAQHRETTAALGSMRVFPRCPGMTRAISYNCVSSYVHSPSSLVDILFLLSY